MSRSQARDLQRYFAHLVEKATTAGTSQKQIASDLKFSGATISTLKSGKKGGLRLDNAEKLAGYFKLDLITALTEAHVWATAHGEPEQPKDKYTHRPEAIRLMATTQFVRPETLERLMTVDPPEDPPLRRWFEIALGLEHLPPMQEMPAEEKQRGKKKR